MPGIITPTYRGGFYSPSHGGTPRYPGLWRGCVGAWNPGLGATGLRLFDQTRFGNHGTLTNMDAGADWVTSQGRHALDFDGTNDFVLTTSRIRPGIAAFSVCFWFSAANASAFGVLLTNRQVAFNASTHKLLAVSQGDGFAGTPSKKIGFIILDTASRYRSVVTNTDIIDGNLHHIAAVSTGSALLVYSDGILQATTLTSAGSWPVMDGGGFVSLGAANDGAVAGAASHFDHAIYSRALNPGEIQLLATRPGVAYETAPRQRSYFAMVLPSGTTVTPDVATLALTLFAPTVSATANQVFVPSAASLSIAAFAPTITATANQTITPDNAALSLTTFTPAITATAPPTDVIATSLSSSSIGIEWTHPGGATSFRLRRRVKSA